MDQTEPLASQFLDAGMHMLMQVCFVQSSGQLERYDLVLLAHWQTCGFHPAKTSPLLPIARLLHSIASFSLPT